METKISVIGFVSALVHSQIYWVYSIIYIAYHKITPNKQSIQKDTKRKKHGRKKSLTNIPKSAIIPTIIPTIHRPVTSPVIKQRKVHRRSSTGQLFKKTLSTLMEVDTRSLIKVDTRSLTEVDTLSSQEEHVSKRDRAIGKIRSKFQKSYSTNDIHSLSQPKRRKRDAIFVIFSGRSNTKEEAIKKRTKLFRSLPSWKKA